MAALVTTMGAMRVGQRAGDLGAPFPDAERLGQADDAPERDREQKGEPEPFGDPHRDMEGLAEAEEGTHRQEVAVRRGLNGAAGQAGVPQMQRVGHEGQRRHHQRQLGVVDDVTGLLNECKDQRAGGPRRGGPTCPCGLRRLRHLPRRSASAAPELAAANSVASFTPNSGSRSTGLRNADRSVIGDSGGVRPLRPCGP